MTRRSEHAGFLPGMFVFPGGRVDQDDGQAHDLAQRGSAHTPERLTTVLSALVEYAESPMRGEAGFGALYDWAKAMLEEIP